MEFPTKPKAGSEEAQIPGSSGLVVFFAWQNCNDSITEQLPQRWQDGWILPRITYIHNISKVGSAAENNPHNLSHI